MRRFFLLLLAFLGVLNIGSAVFAQNEEYYKKDTLPDQERKSTILIPNAEDRKPSAVPLEEKRVPLPILDRLRLGGSFGLAFGSYTNINLSPMAGLNLTDNLLVGAGPTYILTSYKSYSYGPGQRQSNSSFGGRVFAMYNPIPIITLQAEYEGLNVQYYNSYEKRNRRTWLGSPLVGAAYTQPLGARFTRSVHMTLLYNLAFDSQLNPTSGRNISPYSSPFVFRVTFL